jgi:gas vesicle protein
MKREDSGAVITAFLVGAAFGSAVSLLLAPQSGERTRKLLRRKAEDSLDRLTDATEDLAERGRELYDRGKEYASQGAKLAEQKLRSVR